MTTTNASFAFIDAETLHIKAGEKIFEATPAGLTHGGNALTAEEFKEASAAFNTAFEALSKGVVDEPEIDLLRNVVKSHFRNATPHALNSLNVANTLDGYLTAFKDSGAKKLSAQTRTYMASLLSHYPDAKNLLTNPNYNLLHSSQIDLAALEAHGALLKDGFNSLQQLLEKGGATKAEVETIFTKVPGLLKHLELIGAEGGNQLIDAFGQSGAIKKGVAAAEVIDIRAVAGEVAAKANVVSQKAEVLAAKVVEAEAAVKTARWFPGRAQEKLSNAIASFNTYMEGNKQFGGHAWLHVEEKLGKSADVLKGIEGVNMGHFEMASLGTKAEKASGGFFTKAEEVLKKDFEPKQLEGLRGFWNKRTFAGKAAIVAGAGAVTMAVVAAVGGRGKHTEREMDRAQAPAQAAALGA